MLTQGSENLLVVNYWNATIGVFGSCLGWLWSHQALQLLLKSLK